MDADVNPNTTGVRAIAASARPLADLETAINTGNLRGLIVLGHELALGESAQARLAELDALVVLSWREVGAVKAAQVLLPIAAWAETAGSITNRQGRTQRIHAAFPPPGQSVPAWEGVVRLAGALGVKLSWTHAREVFKEMVGAVPELSGAQWGRDTRPVQLRFAHSRG
jgi:predicted molibdopterin-dependent oxidoreductase YjgC